MSNSMSDDYFSFMSNRGRDKPAASRDSSSVKHATQLTSIGPAVPTDIIDFVEESQIEVTESVISDTMIQRIFKRYSNG